MRKIILRSLVSVLFLGLLFYLVREDIPEILRVLKEGRRGLLLVSVLVCLSTIFIMSRRLQLIFAAEDIPIHWVDTSNFTFVGYFFNNFLPTSVGGDIVKALCAAQLTKQPIKSVTTVLLDRIFGLFTFILIPSVTLFFFLNKIKNPAVPAMVYSMLAFSVFFFVLLFNRRFARNFKFIEKILNTFKLAAKVRNIYDGLHNFKNHKWVVTQAMLLSLLGQCVNIFAVYLMALGLGAKAPLIYFFLLVPVVHLMSMLPSLNGLGIREGAYVYFLTPVIGREYAAALGILWLGMLFLLSLIGGLIYFFRHDYHIRWGKNAEIAKEVTG